MLTLANLGVLVGCPGWKFVDHNVLEIKKKSLCACIWNDFYSILLKEGISYFVLESLILEEIDSRKYINELKYHKEVAQSFLY